MCLKCLMYWFALVLACLLCILPVKLQHELEDFLWIGTEAVQGQVVRKVNRVLHGPFDALALLVEITVDLTQQIGWQIKVPI